jgi:hypothetical protein
MNSEKSDANTLLLGSGGTINRVPDTGLKAVLAKLPESIAARLAFMTPEHHLVRNFAVRELPYENGRPIKLDRLAATLAYPLQGFTRLWKTSNAISFSWFGMRQERSAGHSRSPPSAHLIA